MGSLGLPEIIFILVLALLIFGPRRLPEIGRTLGKGMAEFRKASNDLKRTINAELSLEEDEQSRHPRRLDPPMSLVQAISPTAAATPEEPPAAPAGTVAQMSQMTWENPIPPAPDAFSNVADIAATAPASPAPADTHPGPAAESTSSTSSAHPIEPS